MTISLPYYRDYLDDFDIETVYARLDDAGDCCLNAFEACCGRHLRAGRGERIALVHEAPDGSVSQLSYGQLAEQSARLAGYFKAQGLKEGDRIAGMLPRTPELLITVLASWRLGAVYQPLFTAFGPDALEYRLSRANTRLIVTDPANRHKFNDIADCPQILLVKKADESSSETSPQDAVWHDTMQEAPLQDAPPRQHRDAPFMQMFTSGTVGKPKGVAAPLSALPAFALYMELAIDLQDSDRFWNMADPGWAYGLYYAITGPLSLGATTYFCEAPFDAPGALAFLKRHRITNFAGAPTAYRVMKASGLFDDAADSLAIRVASSAGEPLNTEVVNWVDKALGCTVMDHYGQTETGMTCCNHHALAHPKHVGAMGLPLPGYRWRF